MSKTKDKAIVCDIDGTLFLSQEGTIEKQLNKEIYNILYKYKIRFYYKIILLTNRNNFIRKETIDLLIKYHILYDKLIMNTSKKESWNFKKDRLKYDIIPFFDIDFVLDDNIKNIEIIRKLGIRAIQIDGNGSLLERI